MNIYSVTPAWSRAESEKYNAISSFGSESMKVQLVIQYQ